MSCVLFYFFKNVLWFVVICLLINKIYRNIMTYEFFFFFCENFNGLLWYVWFQIKYIKIYWGMNLMPFFGENFNILLWYVCSQIKHIKIYWSMNLIFFFGEKFNALLSYVCSQIKYIKMYWGMNLLLCCDKFASK